MAPTSLFAIALALAISIQGTLGEIRCEDLNENSCAFAVSSTGKRCVLESHSFLRKLGTPDRYTCRTSDIKASDRLVNYIESEECITACGVDKGALGISSDSLLNHNFINKFCSASCYDKCHNIVDLYFNVAAGEGVYIPKVCERHRSGARREMMEEKFNSANRLAYAPTSPSQAKDVLADAPGPEAAAYSPTTSDLSEAKDFLANTPGAATSTQTPNDLSEAKDFYANTPEAAACSPGANDPSQAKDFLADTNDPEAAAPNAY
ncbi:PAR1 protein [Striga hermonthica]|uniref:PAR1 protein n=1 Tax=Striga hermonthica TaxID=68872 RepID=A0A9N7RKL9_STRHE|nr:PAR1 protein [Striga hermonthica]